MVGRAYGGVVGAVRPRLGVVDVSLRRYRVPLRCTRGLFIRLALEMRCNQSNHTRESVNNKYSVIVVGCRYMDCSMS